MLTHLLHTLAAVLATPEAELVQPLAPVTSFNRFVVRQVYGLWMAVQP